MSKACARRLPASREMTKVPNVTPAMPARVTSMQGRCKLVADTLCGTLMTCSTSAIGDSASGCRLMNTLEVHTKVENHYLLVGILTTCMGGVNHCSIHCCLAKFRGLMYLGKYGAVIGRKMHFCVCAR